MDQLFSDGITGVEMYSRHQFEFVKVLSFHMLKGDFLRQIIYRLELEYRISGIERDAFGLGMNGSSSADFVLSLILQLCFGCKY